MSHLALRTPLHLVSTASRIALQPVFSGLVLALLKFGPPEQIDHALDLLAYPRSLGRDGLRTIFQVLLSLGLAKHINNAMNAWALNQWRASAHRNWIWNRELAVVTGGSNGIGKSVVLGLARKGVKVAVLDILELPSEMQAVEGIHFFKCDMTSDSEVIETFETIKQSLGQPSILVNNAGIAQMHSILETSDDFLRKIFGINIMALWSTTKACLPGMINQNKGHIINVASMASFVTIPTSVDYSATKAGVLAFHEGLNCELKHIHKANGVITTVVHPNWVNTNMTSKYADKIERGQGPMLTTEDISSKILTQIFDCRGGQLIIPSGLTLVSTVRGWPNWLQEFLRDRLGSLL